MKTYLALLFCTIVMSAIVIAETVTIQPDGDDGKDAWISDLNETYGDWFYLSGGHYPLNDMQEYRTFIQFNYSAIPEGAQISAAQLLLKYYDGNPFINMYAYAVTDSWIEDNVTWQNKPGYNASYGTQASEGDDWYSWNVTGHVDDVLNGIQPNYGFMLKNSVANNYTMYFSSDYWVENDRPKLVVTYEEEE